MGEFKVAKNPTILQAIGLGSCVSACIFDRSTKIGAMCHIMHSDSSLAKEKINLYRFADQAIEAMVKEMLKLGCHTRSMVAKVFGGASMFQNVLSLNKIGEDNVKVVIEKLKSHDIKVIAKDVGGTVGRSIWFDTTDGSVVVSQINGPTREM